MMINEDRTTVQGRLYYVKKMKRQKAKLPTYPPISISSAKAKGASNWKC